MGFDQMVALLRSKRVDGLGDYQLAPADVDEARKQVRACTACVLGKHARTQMDHRGLERGRRPGEIIHMDTYVNKFLDEHGQQTVEYGVSMVDAFGKTAWHLRVRSKDLVASAVINTLKVIEREFGAKVRRLCCDGGSEFINQTLQLYLQREGVVYRVSPPHTQALNGIAERSIRTFKDMGRTLLHHAGAPSWLWHQAISHAVWVWNRSRIATATGKTPYETASGRVPSLKERTVGVWGSDCFAHKRKELRGGAMAAKSEPGIYLGHHALHNCANVLLLRTNKVVQTRDVKFFNNRFTFMQAYKQGREAMESAADGAGVPLEESDDASDDVEDDMQTQEEYLQPSDNSDSDLQGESEPDPDEQEYPVDKILGRGPRSRTGPPMFRVRWATGEDAGTGIGRA